MSTEIPEGYSFAIRATVGFDGGNHPLKGDVWKCGRCAALLLPDGRPLHDEHHRKTEAALASVASLNEIIAEMTAKVSDDPEFTAMVRDLLRESSRSLGFKFRGD